MELLGVAQLKGIKVPLLNLEGEPEGDDSRVRQEGLLLEEVNRDEARKGAAPRGVPPLFLVGRVASAENQTTRRTTAGGSRTSVYDAEVQSTGSPVVRSNPEKRKELRRRPRLPQISHG